MSVGEQAQKNLRLQVGIGFIERAACTFGNWV
jgi:hypothetical protein